VNQVEIIDQTISVICQNDGCPAKGRPGSHIRRYGKTRKGIQRYQCKVCKSTFTQTKGSFFYNLHTPAEVVIECLGMVADYQTMSSIRRKMEIKEDTLISWMRQSTEHVEEVESLLMSKCDMSRTQMNQFWILVSRYC